MAQGTTHRAQILIGSDRIGWRCSCGLAVSYAKKDRTAQSVRTEARDHELKQIPSPK